MIPPIWVLLLISPLLTARLHQTRLRNLALKRNSSPGSWTWMNWKKLLLRKNSQLRKRSRKRKHPNPRPKKKLKKRARPSPNKKKKKLLKKNQPK